MGQAIIGGFIVLIGIWLKAIIEESLFNRKEKAKSEHAATRLVVELDRFLHKAAAVACDTGRYEGTDPNGYDITETQEDEPGFVDPLSVNDWKSIDKNLLYSYFLIGDKQRDVQAYMQFAARELISGPDGDEWWEARQNGYANLAEYVITVRREFEQTFSKFPLVFKVAKIE